MAIIEPLTNNILRGLSEIIAETSSGLTGSEMGRLFRDCGIADPYPSITKRDRLFEALNQRQIQDKSPNHVLNFIKAVMNPVRYRDNRSLFIERRTRINTVLLFAGLSIGEDGEFTTVKAATTIDEANERAGRLRKKLIDRDVHHDVLKFCKKELLQDNYFHAVFEATKSVADKIREKAGLMGDGADLIDAAFSLKMNTPKLAFNSLQTDSDKSEHKGFANLIKGMFGMFRNVTAHVPKIKWNIDESDALDCLSLASLVHRRLDKCFPTGY